MALLTENDIDRSAFKGQKYMVVGYGSQGRAHALNMKDQGYDITIGLRTGSPSWDKAEADGHKVMEVMEAADEADLIALLIPDMAQEKIWEAGLKDCLKEGNALMFAHGFTIHYGRITPPKNIDVILVAPKGPGDLVRREFERGRGVPCLRAVHQDFTGKAEERAIAYAHGIGGSRTGVLPTTFAEETETDLFGEQAVLCGGVTELVSMGYETLVEAGYQPEAAYFECLHELKLIVDLLHEGGMAKMHDFISETAKYGDFVSGPRVINGETRERMREVLKDIQSGKFAREWILENQAGLPVYKSMWQQDLDHPIEKVGRTLRERMPWLNQKQSNYT